MFPTSISPNQQLLSYEAIHQIGSCFQLVFSSKQAEPSCPLCSTPAQRVHSHYTRFVTDLPVAGYQVMLDGICQMPLAGHGLKFAEAVC